MTPEPTKNEAAPQPQNSPVCYHGTPLNCHCDKCFTESRGTNQRGVTPQPPEKE